MDKIYLNQPDLDGHEADAITEALQGIAYGGTPNQIARFEQACCDASDRSFAVAAGTPALALQAAVMAMGIGPGDEVLCPALAPARLVLAITRCGAIPIFVDVHPRHGAIEAEAAEAAITERTRAIALTAPCGNPSGFTSIAAVSRKFELPILEDAVESFGARVGKDRAGRFGVLAVIGFDAESPLCAAGGAAIISHDDALAALCRQSLDEGRQPIPGMPLNERPTVRTWQYTRRGVDGKLDPLRAALATEVLSRQTQIMERRTEIAEIYVQRLGVHSDLVVPTPPTDAKPSWPAFPVRLDEKFFEEDRDEIILGLLRHDILASGGWPLAPLLPELATAGLDSDAWPIAHRFAARTVRLPCHSRLQDREIDLVCQTLELMMTRHAFSRE